MVKPVYLEFNLIADGNRLTFQSVSPSSNTPTGDFQISMLSGENAGSLSNNFITPLKAYIHKKGLNLSTLFEEVIENTSQPTTIRRFVAKCESRFHLVQN